MKKYLFHSIVVTLAFLYSAFISKPKPTTLTDLVFTGNPMSFADVSNTSKYMENGTHVSGYSCSNTSDIAICKLLSVASKYTHTDLVGDQILNTPNDNPDSEPILTFDISPTTAGSHTYWRIDQINYSDAPNFPALRVTMEDVLMQNGATP
jgi:hypothetical protein